MKPPLFQQHSRSALAVYYYPGTWDWQHELKQSLVHKAVRRSLEEAGALEGLAAATTLLDCYDAWAATVDDFAPVKIEHDVQALVRDPADPELGLLTPDGSGVVYACRVDLLAVDAADEYWVVRHQIVDDWRTVEELVFDEEATAACWAWEQDYIGMEIAGTIHNEIRIDGPLDWPADEPAATARPVAQHEPSGGGRSIPQHVRLAARDARPADGGRIEQRTAGMLRRTRIRRSRDEIAVVGSLLAAEALEMTGARPPIRVLVRTVSHVNSWRRVGPCSKAPTPNRCWRSTFIDAGVTLSRSRDWVRRRGASAEERRRRVGEPFNGSRSPNWRCGELHRYPPLGK